MIVCVIGMNLIIVNNAMIGMRILKTNSKSLLLCLLISAFIITLPVSSSKEKDINYPPLLYVLSPNPIKKVLEPEVPVP
jgi:hypothetical protein